MSREQYYNNLVKKVFLFYSACLLLVVGFVFGLSSTLSVDALKHVSREGNPLEMWTAYFFAAAAILACVKAFLARSRSYFYAGLLMVFAVMREMDLHKEIASDSVFKSRFYSGDAPMDEKLLGAAVVAVLLWLVIAFVRHVPQWVGSLRYGDGASWLIFCTLGTMAVAKFLDSITRLVPPVKGFYETHRPVFVLAEETLELFSSGLFLVFFICVLTGWRRCAQ